MFDRIESNKMSKYFPQVSGCKIDVKIRVTHESHKNNLRKSKKGFTIDISEVLTP